MEEEPLPSANKLKQNLAEEENSNDSTPVNSRSSMHIYFY
jgi:hypothetical protein